MHTGSVAMGLLTRAKMLESMDLDMVGNLVRL